MCSLDIIIDNSILNLYIQSLNSQFALCLATAPDKPLHGFFFILEEKKHCYYFSAPNDIHTYFDKTKITLCNV